MKDGTQRLLSAFVFAFAVGAVHTYNHLLESEMTYTPLRPDQMDNVALDMSLDEDTSSMDEIPQKCPLKPQKKNKGNTFALLLRLIREKEQFVIVEGDYMMALNLLICRLSN